MKKAKFVSGIMLLAVLAGCGGDKQSADEFITVDVTAHYPEKELILQDFMDVEYVALETTDEFITQGVVEDIGKDILLVRNYRDGDIFIYDRKTGKGIRRINRMGQGGEEYSSASRIILDEDNKEIFVTDSPLRKMMVYDLQGNFKRSFKFADTSYYSFIYNYDRDNLIVYKGYSPVDTEEACHMFISKQDGSVTREIPIPIKEIRTPVVITEDFVVMPQYELIFPLRDNNWALMNTSSDTIYTYLPNNTLRPLMVRTPSIQSMDPEVFLFPGSFTASYDFMYVRKKGVNFANMKSFPATDLVYDKQEKALFKCKVYNNDFAEKKTVYMSPKPINNEIAFCHPLQAPDLVEAYEKGTLKGRLKEIAAELNEESNPVIMLIKHKR